MPAKPAPITAISTSRLLFNGCLDSLQGDIVMRLSVQSVQFICAELTCKQQVVGAFTGMDHQIRALAGSALPAPGKLEATADLSA